LRPDELFVDVGANVGSYTILACGAAGARGIAFEPIAATFSRLQENVRLNHLETRVTCVNKAVGAATGQVEFLAGLDTMNRALAPGETSEKAERVEVTSLDQYLDGREPCVLKIDVEGYEIAVLEGATDTLRSPKLRAVIIETIGGGDRYGFDDTWVSTIMSDAGFKAIEYDPLRRTLVRPQVGAARSGNTLFIRDTTAVQKRVQEARTFCLMNRRV
jgi:FkbM family methyltransferase